MSIDGNPRVMAIDSLGTVHTVSSLRKCEKEHKRVKKFCLQQEEWVKEKRPDLLVEWSACGEGDTYLEEWLQGKLNTSVGGRVV